MNLYLPFVNLGPVSCGWHPSEPARAEGEIATGVTGA